MTSARSSIGRLHFGFSVGSATVLRYQTIEALFEEKKLFDGTLKIDCSWVVAGRQGFGGGAVLHCFQGADVLRDELGSSGAYFLTIQLTKEYTSSFTINWSECCLAPPQIPKIPVASGSGRAPGTRGQRWILFLKIALLAFRLGAQQATSIPAHAIEQEHAAAPVSPFRIRPKGGCPICGRRPVAAGVDALWFLRFQRPRRFFHDREGSLTQPSFTHSTGLGSPPILRGRWSFARSISTGSGVAELFRKLLAHSFTNSE